MSRRATDATRFQANLLGVLLICRKTTDVKGRKVGEFRGSDIGDIRYVLNPSLRKPRSSAKKKKEPLILERPLKILVLSRGLKLLNSKPGCKVSALHFFVK